MKKLVSVACWADFAGAFLPAAAVAGLVVVEADEDEVVDDDFTDAMLLVVTEGSVLSNLTFLTNEASLFFSVGSSLTFSFCSSKNK